MDDSVAPDGATRRTFLHGLGSAATAFGASGLAGCTALGSGSGNGSGNEIRVAYMPIFPDMQYFVMREEGYFDAIDATVTGKRFTDGPSIVQAYASGEIDVAMFGIVPAMIVVDKGIAAKLVTANVENAMHVLATDEFAGLWEQRGADAFAAFEKRNGRKFTFGTFPPGSVPDIALRYWLERSVGVSTDAVDIVPMGGAGPVRQALLAGKIDGSCIMQPVPTIVAEHDAPYTEIARSAEFMPGQPAAVSLMSDDLRTSRPKLAKAFVEQHVRATRFIRKQPDGAAADASAVVGPDTLPVDVARKAMGPNFISNPHDIVDGTKVFSRYAEQLGKIDTRLSIDQLIDFSLYDEVTG